MGAGLSLLKLIRRSNGNRMSKRKTKPTKIDKEKEARSLKVSIHAGSDRFWAKRGGDPYSTTSYNYGDKKKKLK